MDERIVRAEDLERMSPAEREAVFAAAIQWDLDNTPADFLDRVRDRIAPRLDEPTPD